MASDLFAWIVCLLVCNVRAKWMRFPWTSLGFATKTIMTPSPLLAISITAKVQEWFSLNESQILFFFCCCCYYFVRSLSHFLEFFIVDLFNKRACKYVRLVLFGLFPAKHRDVRWTKQDSGTKTKQNKNKNKTKKSGKPQQWQLFGLIHSFSLASQVPISTKKRQPYRPTLLVSLPQKKKKKKKKKEKGEGG